MTQLPDGFDIRYTVEKDQTLLRQWLLEPGVLHWFPMSPGVELDLALQGWIGFCRFEASLTATVHGEPCAVGTLYLMPYRKVAHECLLKLIVAPKWQHNGIGTSIIKNLMNLAKTKFYVEICYFEIVEGNPLEKILQTLGYTTSARQEMYFKENGQYYARLIYDYDFSKKSIMKS